MKFSQPLPLSSFASLINAEIIGDANAQVLGINEIHKVINGDLCFVDHPKYYNTCLQSEATHIIINTKDVVVPSGKNLLFVQDPFEAYLTIVNHYRPFTPSTKMIDDSAVIGQGTVLMPNVFIGKQVKIGSNCIIHTGACIHAYSELGNNVIIQSGTVIGGDAFYYNTKKNRDVWFKKMQSCGNVVIEDDVEIGCCCTIDRGVTASTFIGRGTKMDNMVHIGHDNYIGRNCLIAAQVGIAGTTVVEDGVTLWGQVGVNKTIRIGAGAVAMGRAGVTSSLEAGKSYFGYPAQETRAFMKELVWIKRIPEMWQKIKQLTEKNNTQNL